MWFIYGKSTLYVQAWLASCGVMVRDSGDAIHRGAFDMAPQHDSLLTATIGHDGASLSPTSLDHSNTRVLGERSLALPGKLSSRKEPLL